MIVEYGIGGGKHDLETTWNDEDLDYMAADAAKDYFENCDGWEASWPIDFEIFIDGDSKGTFTVELEHEPTFSATPK